MKKTALIIILSFLSIVSFAQINKGQWLTGGNIGFRFTENNSITQTTIKAPINIGYFIANKFAIGLRGGFNYEKIKYPGVNSFEMKTRGFDGGLFLRYYVLPGSKRINFLIDGTCSYGYLNQYVLDINPYYFGLREVTLRSMHYTMNMGPVFFINKNVVLEFLVGYNYSDYLKDESHTSTFFAAAGLQIHLGKGKSQTN